MEYEPSPRSRHCSIAIQEKIYLFGGSECKGKELSLVHVFDQFTESWQTNSALGIPPALHKTACLSSDYRVYVRGELNSFYQLDADILQWRKLPPGPSSMIGCEMAYDATGKLVLFGGRDPLPKVTDQYTKELCCFEVEGKFMVN